MSDTTRAQAIRRNAIRRAYKKAVETGGLSIVEGRHLYAALRTWLVLSPDEIAALIDRKLGRGLVKTLHRKFVLRYFARPSRRRRVHRPNRS